MPTLHVTLDGPPADSDPKSVAPHCKLAFCSARTRIRYHGSKNDCVAHCARECPVRVSDFPQLPQERNDLPGSHTQGLFHQLKGSLTVAIFNSLDLSDINITYMSTLAKPRSTTLFSGSVYGRRLDHLTSWCALPNANYAERSMHLQLGLVFPDMS